MGNLLPAPTLSRAVGGTVMLYSIEYTSQKRLFRFMSTKGIMIMFKSQVFILFIRIRNTSLNPESLDIIYRKTVSLW